MSADAIVVAGDRPLVRFGQGAVLNGTFMAALVRGGQAKWLHDFSDNTSKYRADRMEWLLQDASFGRTLLILRAVPPASANLHDGAERRAVRRPAPRDSSCVQVRRAARAGEAPCAVDVRGGSRSPQ